MIKALTQKLNAITGPLALAGFLLLLMEHTSWAQQFPHIIRSINLGILGLFAADVMLSLVGAKNRADWIRRHWFDFIVFVPLVQLFYAPPNSALSVVLRQMAIVAMLISRTRRAQKFIILLSLKPAHLMLMSFAGAIVIGAVLLMLPGATVAGKTTTLLNALFTSTSAVCVTGLIVHDTATHFTFFGQAVILGLIQLGGLGIMTFSVALSLLLHRSVSMKNQSIMQDVLDQETLQNVQRLIGFIILMTLLLETVGAISLYFALRPHFSASETLWHAIFHSVSAFCNAGFSTFSDSLSSFALDIHVNATVGSLIILGGIGFVVINDFYQAIKKRLFQPHSGRHRFRIQSRLALGWTGALILLGTGLIFWIERSELLAGLSYKDALLVSLFQSITTRTAGFNTCAIGALQPVTLFLFIMFMFIGACPGGTGGGIKTTAPAVLWAVARAGLMQREKTEIYRRTIPIDVIRKAVIVLCTSLLLVCASVVLMAILDPDKDFMAVSFEIVSAFGTVGLSTGITDSLSRGGRILIVVLMFIGRLGPLTLGFAFMRKVRPVKFSYAEERIMIG